MQNKKKKRLLLWVAFAELVIIVIGLMIALWPRDDKELDALHHNAGDVAEPDEDLKLQALALSGSGLYGFVNGKRPGKTECKDHYGFQYFSNHFRCHAFIPLKLNFRNALCKKF